MFGIHGDAVLPQMFDIKLRAAGVGLNYYFASLFGYHPALLATCSTCRIFQELFTSFRHDRMAVLA